MSVRDEIFRYLVGNSVRRVSIPLEIRTVSNISVPIAMSKALFGLPIIVPGEKPCFKGQYVTHSVYNGEDGTRRWVIKTGIFSIMAVFVERETRVYYPFAELGLLTAIAPTILEWIRRGYDDYGRRFAGYFEAVGNFDVDIVECREDDILYLDKVTNGELPIIIVDKYNILRSQPPSEFFEEYASLQFAYRELVRQKAEYERRIRRLELQVATREAEYRVIKQDLDELVDIVNTLLRENERLREELSKRDVRDRFRYAKIEVYESMIHSLQRTITELSVILDRIVSMREKIEKLVPTPPTVVPTPPTPTKAKPEEKKEERKYVIAKGE